MEFFRSDTEMKDSGIEWVGLIPKTWKIAKNNRLFNISKQLVNEAWSETQLLSLTKAGIIEKNINEGGGKQPESFATYQYVDIDDIVLCLFDIDVSAVFSDRSKYKGMISPAYRVMKCTDAILPNYAKWWFDAVNIGRYYLIYTKSLRKTIDIDGFGNILTAIPPIGEQKDISDFLEDKCTKIDEIIKDANSTIEKYKTWKVSIIRDVVTKGVAEGGSYKQSGVDWIGEIPCDWECIKIKYVSNISRGLFNHRPRNDERLYDGPYPFIQTGDVARAGQYITEYKQTLSEMGKNVSKLFPKGTLTMTIAANVGDVAILDFDAYFPDSVLGFVPKKNIDNKYLYYIFSAMKQEFIRTAIASTQLNLNVERVKELFIPITYNSDEQEAINHMLDSKCNRIDELITEKQLLVENLEKYRNSLIFETVTGKRKVV